MKKQKKTTDTFSSLSLTQWRMAGQRFVKGSTFSSIGKLYGVSRQRVHQIVERVRNLVLNA